MTQAKNSCPKNPPRQTTKVSLRQSEINQLASHHHPQSNNDIFPIHQIRADCGHSGLTARGCGQCSVSLVSLVHQAITPQTYNDVVIKVTDSTRTLRWAVVLQISRGRLSSCPSSVLASVLSYLSGGGVSEGKLEKAHMTMDDWMALTNRPDVVEKDMVRLLDWFIKVGS